MRPRPTPVSAGLALLLGSSLVTVPALAQSGPISPDRPSVSYGTSTVPRGRFQLESGFEVRLVDGGSSLALPFGALRAGLGSRTDVLVLLPGWTRVSEGGATTSGFGDLALGGRHRVADGGSARVALLGLVTLPTGSDEFRGATTVRGGAAVEADAGGGATLFSTGLVAVLERGDRLAADLELSVGIGGALAARTSGFVEAFAMPRGRRAPDNAGFLAGLGWLLSNDLQLDAYAGLDVAGPATFIGGAGLSIRW